MSAGSNAVTNSDNTHTKYFLKGHKLSIHSVHFPKICRVNKN